MPDRLRYLVGGQIAASDINYEFNRSETTYFDIWTARNGGYGAINDASSYRPTANGQSGYEWNDWWGYTHSAVYPYVYVFVEEITADANIRLYKYNAYNVADWSEQWYFNNIGPWENAQNISGVPARQDDRLQVYWYHFGWGNPLRTSFKAVYSNVRGYVIYYGCDVVSNNRINEINPIWGGESLYVYYVESYC